MVLQQLNTFQVLINYRLAISHKVTLIDIFSTDSIGRAANNVQHCEV